MNADAAFVIGKTHQVCQDYAIAGQSHDKFYIAVSDGCSSAKDTDMGSRLLVHAMMHEWHGKDETPEEMCMVCSEGVIPHYVPTHMFRAYDRAMSWSKIIGLDEDAMLATLLTCRVEDNDFLVHVAGDGVVVARRKDGGVIVTDFDYPSNAPFYLAYFASAKWRSQYMKNFGASLNITKYNLHCDTEVPLVESSNVTDMSPKVLRYPLDQYDMVMLFTDGVRTFYENVKTQTSLTQKAIPYLKVIEEITEFKNYTGGFVQRRLKRALGVFESRGWHHADDISFAAIHGG